MPVVVTLPTLLRMMLQCMCVFDSSQTRGSMSIPAQMFASADPDTSFAGRHAYIPRRSRKPECLASG
jgi:hypothetical protein